MAVSSDAENPYAHFGFRSQVFEGQKCCQTKADLEADSARQAHAERLMPARSLGRTSNQALYGYAEMPDGNSTQLVNHRHVVAVSISPK
jgi:hypothetical protein